MRGFSKASLGDLKSQTHHKGCSLNCDALYQKFYIYIGFFLEMFDFNFIDLCS